MAALTGALMALQGASAVSSYSTQRRQGNYEAAIAGQNAGLADAQATQATFRGAEAASRARAQGRQVVGAQRAGYSASGVDVATGSPVDVAGDTARISELDAMTLQNNAALEAYGYKVQSAGFRADQQNAKQRAKDSWTTLLTGAGNMFGTYAANRSSAQPSYDPNKPLSPDNTPTQKDYDRWGKTMAQVKIGRK